MKGQEQSFSSPSPTGTWSISPAHSISWPVWRHWAPQHHPKGAGHGPGGALSSPEALVRTGQCWQQVSIPISSSTFQLPKQTGPGSSTNTGGELGLEGATPRDARALTAPPSTGHCQQGTYLPPGLGERMNYNFPEEQGCLPSWDPASLSTQCNSIEEEGEEHSSHPLSNSPAFVQEKAETGFVYAGVLF